MKITPLGAAGEVTGSSFLLEAGESKYLVDCGLFQGDPESEERNRSFPFDPKEIEAVFLTHAHLDHCGRIPLLFKKGFRGKIYSTSATRDLAQFILLDAAKVQEEDFLRQSRKKKRAGEETFPPLYSEGDVLYSLALFSSVPYNSPIPLSSNSRVTFRQSGHVLGSAFLVFEEQGKRVVFSGDLGSPHRNVVPDPEPPPECDLVFCESTYGDRSHKTLEESVEELKEAINWAFEAGGNVAIPSFALERAQDILYYLRVLREKKQVPQNPVFLDSPLSINLTEVYQHHIEELDEELRALISQGKDPFHFPGLEFTPTVEQSRAINQKNRVIVIAGSGMCQGGRILHHLKHNLWRDDSAIVFVGYQARNTLGRAIVDGAKKVHIFGELIAVKAKIYTINGFSAHGDKSVLLDWLKNTGKAEIILNHGEENSSSSLAMELKARQRSVDVAEQGKVYEI
jgi:metallo-beta-lactamase family protein